MKVRKGRARVFIWMNTVAVENKKIHRDSWSNEAKVAIPNCVYPIIILRIILHRGNVNVA